MPRDRQPPPTPEPWERQPDESVVAFEAFITYRDDPQRSTEKVARKLGKSKQIIGRWSRAYGWVDRVKAWEDHLDATIRRPLMEKRVSEALDRHLMNARIAQDALLIPFLELKRRYETIKHQGHPTSEPCPLLQGDARTQCTRLLDVTQLTQKELLLLTARNATAQLAVVDIERATLGLPTIRGSKSSEDGDGPNRPALPGTGRVINVITRDPPKKKLLLDNGNGGPS